MSLIWKSYQIIGLTVLLSKQTNSAAAVNYDVTQYLFTNMHMYNQSLSRVIVPASLLLYLCQRLKIGKLNLWIAFLMDKYDRTKKKLRYKRKL
jgi:hypothetical protein